MDNKLPKVFVNEIKKDINNSQKTYKSNSFDRNFINKRIDKNDIDKIFASKSHIYKSRVIIKLLNQDIDTYIVSRTNDSVITFDNKKIPFKDILDINLVK